MKLEFFYIIAIALMLVFSLVAWFIAKIIQMIFKVRVSIKDHHPVEMLFSASNTTSYVNLGLSILFAVLFVFAFRYSVNWFAYKQLAEVDVVRPTLEKLGYDSEKLAPLQYGLKYRINKEAQEHGDDSVDIEQAELMYESEVVTRFINEFFQDDKRKFHSSFILNYFDQVLLHDNKPIPAVDGIASLILKLSGQEAKKDKYDQLVAYLKEQYSPPVAITPAPYPVPKNILYGIGKDHEDVLQELNKIYVNEEEGHLGVSFVIAYLDNLGKVMQNYFQVSNQLSGVIQLLIFILYFWAITIISTRVVILKREKNIVKLWNEFMKKHGKDIDEKTRGKEIIPVYSEVSETEVQFEHKMIEQFTDFIMNEKGKQHKQAFFTLKILQKLWSQLVENISKDIHSKINSIMESIFHRTEKNLSQIEYSVVDYIIWAIPSLGFIGTVLGISLALGNAGAVVKAPDVTAQAFAITDVTTLLAVAFDTTLVALICNIPLIFLIQGIKSRESKFFSGLQQKIANFVTERLKNN